MSEYTISDPLSIGYYFELIAQKLTLAGFTALREFSAVDSLIHHDEMIAYYRMTDCAVTASTVRRVDGLRYIEADCGFELRLFGRSCKFSDYIQFFDSCTKVFSDIVTDTEMLVVSLELGDTVQSMQLNRLQRDMHLTMRICLKEEDQ